MRALRSIVKTILLGLTFVVAVVIGVLLHIEVAPARRALGTRVTQILAPLFRGRIVIERINRLSLRELDAQVRIDDLAGVPLIEAKGAHVRFDLYAFFESLRSGAPLEIDLTRAAIDHLEVRLDADDAGSLAIVRAFEPQKPSAPSTSPSRGVHLSLLRIEVAHAWAHGVIPGAPPIDADLDDLHGAMLLTPSTLSIDVDRVALEARAVPVAKTAKGELTAHLQIPSAHGPLGARGSWRGSVGDISESLEAAIDGSQVDLVLDAPTIAPDALRSVWPDSTISVTGAAHVEAHGSLPKLQVGVTVALASASVTVEGPVTVAPEARADLEIDSHSVDARAIAPGAPPSKLDARGAITLARHADGSINASTAIDFAGGLVGNRHAPAARLDAQFKRDGAGRLSGEATLVSRDPKIRGRIALRLLPKGDSFEVAYDAVAHTPELAAIDWLDGVAHGATNVRVRGTLDVARGTIDTHGEADLDEVGLATAQAHHVVVVFDARGPVRAPTIDATLHADMLDVGGVRIDSVHIDAHGPLSNAHVDVDLHGGNVPDLTLEANVGVLNGASLRDVAITLARNGETVRAHVDAVRADGGRVKVDGAVVEGLGAPAHVSFEATRDALRVQAEARDLHLGQIGRLAGIEDQVRRGKLAVDVDALIRRGSAQGTLTLNLEGASVGDLDGVAAKVDASIHGRSITGSVHAQLADAGSIDVVTEGLQIDDKLPVLESLRRPWGRVEIDGHILLAKLASALPPDTLPVDVDGEVTLHGRAWRDSMNDETLGVLLDVRTSDFALAGRPPATWKIDGIDVALYSRLDGETGFTDVNARLNDATGELVTLDFKADTLPFGELVSSRDRALAALRTLVFNAQVLVPERSLASLPEIIDVAGLRGKLSARLDVHGPLDHVAADATAKVTKAHLEESDISMPLDLAMTAHYDGAKADVTLGATARAKPVLDASAVLEGRLTDVLDAASLAVPWKASAKAHLDSFPLEGVSTLADRQVAGKVTGDLALDGLHDNARATLSVGLSGLQIGDVAFPDGAMKLAIDGQSLDAMAKLDQTDGSFRVTAHAEATWGSAVLPALDPKTPFHAEITAKSFRAETLLPFVDSSLTELDGRIDASATVTLDPKARKAMLDGTVTLKDGRFEMAAIGGEFRDATATLKFTPDGVVTLSNVTANAMSGRIQAAATARVDGQGLVGANATIQIPKSKPLLLSVEGAQVGMVDGAVNLTATASANRKDLAVKVDLPSLHVLLPEQTTRKVQILGGIDGVSVGTSRSGSFKSATLDPLAAAPEVRSDSAMRVDIAVALGDDVQVRRGSTVNILLEGKPTIAITDRTRVAGQVHLHGSIDVQGKKFDIEEGTVTFVGDDPSNPQVVLSATWTADDEDSTVVTATFVGPLNSGVVNLTSDPFHSKSEILSLLLFGTADGMSTNSTTTTTTVGAAGGAATQPLNRALQQFGLGGVQARIDTSTTSPRPEVVFQIARDISVQIAWVLLITPGQNPDTTLLTFDWRFRRAWSLATTVGNEGTSIMDLLWHYRY